jgi:hypothetical protein
MNPGYWLHKAAVSVSYLFSRKRYFGEKLILHKGILKLCKKEPFDGKISV